MNPNRLSLGSHFLTTKKKNDLSELFTSFDKDKDGRISNDELKDMLNSAGLNSTSLVNLIIQEKYVYG